MPKYILTLTARDGALVPMLYCFNDVHDFKSNIFTVKRWFDHDLYVIKKY